MGAFGIEVDRDAVRIFRDAISKHDALDQLVDCLAHSNAVTDATAFRNAVHEREAVMSTGIGSGVAIPHVRIAAVAKPAVGIGLSREGISFNTLDDQPVNIMVLFAMPQGSQKDYLGLLAKVMLVLKEADFRDNLLACESPEAVAELLNAPAG